MTPTLDDLERDLRRVLAREAAAFRPQPREVPAGRAGGDGRRVLVAIAAVTLPVLLLVGAVLLLGTDGNDQEPAVTSTTDVPHLVLDGMSGHLNGESTGQAPPEGPNRLQSFRTADGFDGPMVFVTTVTDRSSFGLREFGTIIGLGQDFASTNVEIDDETALRVVAAGLSVDELRAFIAGLQRRDDGLWRSTDPELVEVGSPPATDGATWEVVYDGVQVNLYADGFESRLVDRIESTASAVEDVDLDGVPATLGAYSDSDWWVLAEPSPGRAVQLRIRGTRADVDTILAAARWVDEATWRDSVGG